MTGLFCDTNRYLQKRVNPSLLGTPKAGGWWLAAEFWGFSAQIRLFHISLVFPYFLCFSLVRYCSGFCKPSFCSIFARTETEQKEHYIVPNRNRTVPLSLPMTNKKDRRRTREGRTSGGHSKSITGCVVSVNSYFQ